MSWIRAAFAICIAGLALAASAQQPQQPNPMDVVPDKMPNDIPYGTPVTLERAQAAINAAVAESNKRGWKLNVAVVDSGANLVAFARMDGAQIGSIAISEHKARASVKFRREELRDVDTASRELLLVEVLHQRLQRRPAACDRIVPGNLAAALDLVDHPGQADGERIGVVHVPLRHVARAQERAVQAHREPRIRVVDRLAQHEGMHDR